MPVPAKGPAGSLPPRKPAGPLTSANTVKDMERHTKGTKESPGLLTRYTALRGVYENGSYRSPIRNGLPVPKFYTYRGLGYDVLDPPERLRNDNASTRASKPGNGGVEQ